MRAILSVDDRLQTLLSVKRTVSYFDCALTRDICDLIDREADLLNRGLKGDTFSGARPRLSNLFLQFIEATMRCQFFRNRAIHDRPSWVEKTQRDLWAHLEYRHDKCDSPRRTEMVRSGGITLKDGDLAQSLGQR